MSVAGVAARRGLASLSDAEREEMKRLLRLLRAAGVDV
jgi:hypothetical protein